MLHHLDESTLTAFADQREAIKAARGRANGFASAELAAAQAHVNALLEGRSRLGGTPAPAGFVTAAEWRDAADRHTFAISRYDLDITAAEQRLAAARDDHARLLAEVPTLAAAYRDMVVAALDDLVVTKVNEAADIATARESLLVRFKMSSQPVRLMKEHHDGLRFQVQSAGYSDLSWFNASARRDGFTPDKSNDLAFALDLI